jgi:hypothetical protein
MYVRDFKIQTVDASLFENFTKGYWSLLLLHGLKKIVSYNISIAAILAYMGRNTSYKCKLTYEYI